jgi:hypothetical protein
MATEKQRAAAKKNIKQAQQTWKTMSKTGHSRSQPSGRARAKPGTGGGGSFYRVVVRPKTEFVAFRNQDIGSPGHIQRLAGKRQSGSWDTQAWLISKDDAHTEGDRLVPDTADARHTLEALGSEPTHDSGDVFTARDRRNIPESEKPTPAQTNARSANIRKAQRERWSR